MERTLRRLLRVHSIARNWTILSNYTAPLQVTRSLSQIYSTNLTDRTSLEDIKPLKNYIFNDIKVERNFMKILEMAATNYIDMSVHDAVEMISALFKAFKYERNMQKVQNHIGFTRLCEVLNRDVRQMKITDIIETLKVFTYLNVPSNTLLIQSMLQVIRKTVNEISPQNIIFIVFLLKKMESTPLRDALLIALPLVFEVQVSTKLDSDNIVSLVSSLRFANEYRMNPDIHHIIYKALWKFQNNLDVQIAKSIYCSLCSTSCLSSIAFQVLSNVENVLITKVNELSVQEIIMILNKLTFVTLKNKDHGYKFFNEELINTFVNTVLSLNINFNDGISLLKLLNHLDYAHVSLLEHLATKLIKEPNLMQDASYFTVFTFLEGLVNANYKPIIWDPIRDAILENKMENKSSSKSLINFALHFIALDCYSPNLLRKVFLMDIMNNEMMKNVYAKELLLLHQSIKTLYPMYNGPWQSSKTIEYAINLRPTPCTHSFRVVLERALGGPQYICNDLRTKLGHYVDHVIVMRKGGYPVAINTSGTSVSYVEDIQTPSESQMILIFNSPDIAYSVNLQRLKGIWSLNVKSAEILTNSNAIVINYNFWMKLPEHERMPYVMHAIKSKCDDLLVSAN